MFITQFQKHSKHFKTEIKIEKGVNFLSRINKKCNDSFVKYLTFNGQIDKAYAYQIVSAVVTLLLSCLVNINNFAYGYLHNTLPFIGKISSKHQAKYFTKITRTVEIDL